MVDSDPPLRRDKIRVPGVWPVLHHQSSLSHSRNVARIRGQCFSRYWFARRVRGPPLHWPRLPLGSPLPSFTSLVEMCSGGRERANVVVCRGAATHALPPSWPASRTRGNGGGVGRGGRAPLPPNARLGSHHAQRDDYRRAARRLTSRAQTSGGAPMSCQSPSESSAIVSRSVSTETTVTVQ